MHPPLGTIFIVEVKTIDISAIRAASRVSIRVSFWVTKASTQAALGSLLITR
jgi:hypothetical protein